MMKKSVIAFAVSSLMGLSAAYAAVVSAPTELVVGFKPVYQNTTGAGAVTGDLKPGATLAVDPDKLDFYDADGDAHHIAAVKYSWLLAGSEISTSNSVTLPAGNEAVGKNVTLSVTPVTETGDPIEGDPLVLSNLNLAGAGGGDGEGNVGTDEDAKPFVTHLNMKGLLQQGQTITATYQFHANGGEPTDKSTYAWGHKGTTATAVGTNAIATGGEVPGYLIQPTDAGEVLEVSVEATNGLGLKGNTLTVASDGDVTDKGEGSTGGEGSGGNGDLEGKEEENGKVPFIKADPEAVTITFTSTATVALNGVEGVRPVAAKNLMTAEITTVPGASSEVTDYLFQWKVDGSNVGDAVAGNTTFMPQGSHQGQAVTVEVTPAP